MLLPRNFSHLTRSGRLLVALGFTTALTLSGCQSTQNEVKPDKPHNTIFLIGDGMGIAQTTAYRYYKANQNKRTRGDDQTIAATEFDKILVGMAATYPADDTLVTDSAASATALATGFKSFNGAIGVTPDHDEKITLIERAKALGLTTGIVATSQINHATPASFLAHIDSRHKLDEIADQYLANHLSSQETSAEYIDILLGGGTKYFDSEERKLVDQFQSTGFQYIDQMEDLDQLNQIPAMGLFAPKGLPFAIDSQRPNRLTRMTKTALRLASTKPNGFFLMIEASQIDWCSHGNDIACTMAEMADFENTLSVVLDFAKQHGNTTVVVTADHSTGGLTLGRDGKYLWHAELVHKINISAERFSTLVSQGESPVTLWQKYVNLPLSQSEKQRLLHASQSSDPKNIHAAFTTITSAQTGTGWTTSGHTAEDVQVYAYGPYQSRFVGYQDNTDLATKLFTILEQTK